jgi:hypothetical protein
MKKTIYILIIFAAGLMVFFTACEKNDNPQLTKKLKNCQIEYLFFKDDILMASNSNIGFPPNDTSKTKCSYLYSDDKIVRSAGGFIQIPFSNDFVFSADAFDSIVFNNNTVNVHSKYRWDGVTFETGYESPTIFNLEDNNGLVSIIKKDQFHPNGFELNYTYSGNQIIESDSSRNIFRTFFFENNNLTRVLKESHDLQGDVFSRKEILFQEYDNKPNPLKNKYYVRGAFFRSFSTNNYKSYTVNEYYQSSEGELVLGNSFSFSMPILYDAEGYPMFGDYE